MNRDQERLQAIAFANRILDRPWGDPDDDYAVLARQFLRTLEIACWQPLKTLPTRAAMGCDLIHIQVGGGGGGGGNHANYVYDGNPDGIRLCGSWTHWRPVPPCVEDNVYDPRAGDW
jgi:hypothetical protein